MVKKKRVSKRVTLKDKYKIERKVKEHARKARRASRAAHKNGSAYRNLKRKDPGLPNLLPYKEKFLRQLKAEREKEVGQQNKRMALRRDALRSGTAEDLAQAAAEREAAFLKGETVVDEFVIERSAKKKKRQYLKELRDVVDLSDVILLVLDARDPAAGRADIVEKLVLESANRKRLVIVLNKIDLVPKNIVEDWLSSLRKEYPTVAFRASTQNQKSRYGRAGVDSIALGAANKGVSSKESSIGESVCVGADTLLQLLKNYSRNKNIKTAITVGVVGYPNVGKSSVINSLKRCRAVGVSPTPGFTKSLQVVHVDKKVKVIDSPGVLFHDSLQDMNGSPALVLQNCVNPALLDDPITPVNVIFERCDHEKLMISYGIAKFASAQELITLVAKKRGKLKAGGVPDLVAASRLILQDWCTGKIQYFTPAPKNVETKQTREQAQVVATWAKEFDLDSLLQMEASELVKHDEDGDAMMTD